MACPFARDEDGIIEFHCYFAEEVTCTNTIVVVNFKCDFTVEGAFVNVSDGLIPAGIESALDYFGPENFFVVNFDDAEWI